MEMEINGAESKIHTVQTTSIGHHTYVIKPHGKGSSIEVLEDSELMYVLSSRMTMRCKDTT